MIYIVVAVYGYENISNVLVTTDIKKALSCKKEDYDGCTSLIIEKWENGKLKEEIRC